MEALLQVGVGRKGLSLSLVPSLGLQFLSWGSKLPEFLIPQPQLQVVETIRVRSRILGPSSQFIQKVKFPYQEKQTKKTRATVLSQCPTCRAGMSLQEKQDPVSVPSSRAVAQRFCHRKAGGKNRELHSSP